MSEIDRSAMLAGEVKVEDLTSIFDYDGTEYKVNASLIGKDLSFGGKYEEYNAELLSALREGWIKIDGSLTEKGQKELARRKLGMSEYEKLKKEEAEQKRQAREAKKQASEKKDFDDKKARIKDALEDVGYKGKWRLKRDRRAPGGFFIMFKETEGQIEEDKVIAKESFDDLLEFIRSELPKMIRYK